LCIFPRQAVGKRHTHAANSIRRNFHPGRGQRGYGRRKCMAQVDLISC
jgi:hypothetical protein